MKTGIELIAEERQRQIDKGWSQDHDKGHNNGELSGAAACYAINKHELGDSIRVQYLKLGDGFFSYDHEKARSAPKEDKWIDAFPFHDADNRDRHGRLKSLQIAGALIAAEIDRLQRESIKDK